MATFYLDRKDSEVKLEQGVLIVRSGESRQTMPLALLERLVVAAKTRLDSTMLLQLAEQGISVLILDPRRLERRAQVLGKGHNNAKVRLKQYQASTDETLRLHLAREWIAAKVRRHAALLHKTTTSRLMERSLQEALKQLESLGTLLGTATSFDKLRGLEGSAAQVFFGVYHKLFAPALGFCGRKKRPPPDPVNAVLSLAYTLLHARAAQIAWASGLDPQLGFYHEPAWGRQALACDLIEPWRPCVDEWVYEWFHSRYLRVEDFKYHAEGCFLGKAGRAKFFAAFESRMPPIERALRWQCRYVVRRLTAGGDNASAVSQ